jgi:hypothetical protein
MYEVGAHLCVRPVIEVHKGRHAGLPLPFPVHRLLAVPSVPRGTLTIPFTLPATRAGLPSHMPTPGGASLTRGY